MKKHLSNQTRKRMLSILGMLLLSVPFVLAQVLVKGTVKDNLGEGVPGASVQVKGTSQGTITDLDGKFTLNIPQKNATLVISFIGYVTVEQKADSQKPMVITLKEDTKTLDEVVVVGYQEVRRRDLTGSVAKANMADVLTAPVASFDQALGGRIAGVNVTSGEGMPGGNMSIVIRGNNSLTQENSPLFVIDGFPIEDSSAASTLNPSDIESLDFLKDASATAIYGARGANGVVIITTKKGKVGRAQLSYDGSFGVQHVTRTIPMMDAYEFVKLQNEMYPTVVAGSYLMNYEGKQWTLDDYKNIPQYNWQDEIFKTAWQQNHTVRLAGGTEGVRYNASLSYFDQDGTLIETGYKRMQGRMNTVVRRGKLNMSLTTNYSRSIQTGSTPSSTSYSGMNNLFYSVWGYRPVTSPDTPLSFLMDSSTDNAVDSSNDYRFNPIKSQKNEYRKSYTNNLQMNGFAEYEVLKGLKLKVSAGYTYDSRKQDQFNNSNTRYGGPTSTDKVNAQVTRQERLTWLNENTLTYQTNIKKKHFLNVLGGITFQNSDYEIYSFRTTHIPNESLGMAGMSEGQAGTTTSAKSSWAMLSYLGRVTYNYMSKYYATVSFRADGSSKFNKDNRYGYFPSGSLAWSFSEEEFIRDNFGWVSFGKLRASWGRSGMHFSQNYLALGIMNVGGTSYLGNGYIEPQWGDGLYNNELSWEETDQYDFGLDLDMFDHRLSITIDYYYRYTDKLLDRVRLPSAGINTGYNMQWRNTAAVSNEGLELMVKYEIFRKPDLYWKISVNAARNWNRFEKSYTGKDLDGVRVIGKSLNGVYALKTDGYVNYQEEVPVYYNQIGIKAPLASEMGSATFYKPGDYKFVDVDGNRKITAFDDEVYCGSALPKITGGIVNEFQWKNFDINLLLSFQLGRHMLNITRTRTLSGFGAAEYPAIVMNLDKVSFWEKPGDTPDFPKWQYDWDTYLWGGRYVDRNVEKVNWLKIKTLSIGYTLPKVWMQKCGLGELRIFASGENLCTFTNYSGIEPEIVDIRNGEDVGASYPLARKLTLGLTLKF